VLIPFAPFAAFAQGSHVLLNDAKVVVTEVEVSPTEPYALTQDANGAVWVALDPINFLSVRGDLRESRQILAGDSGKDASGEELQFEASGSAAHLVIIHTKTPHQELTVGPFGLESSIEDASGRNATLLVAITDCRFRDTRNLGDESSWVPSKPSVVEMKAGTVKWVDLVFTISKISAKLRQGWYPSHGERRNPGSPMGAYHGLISGSV
jgi:hypothetical protein